MLGQASIAFTLQTHTHPDEAKLDRAAAASERAPDRAEPVCNPFAIVAFRAPTKT